jgi:hypothetical protein
MSSCIQQPGGFIDLCGITKIYSGTCVINTTGGSRPARKIMSRASAEVNCQVTHPTRYPTRRSHFRRGFLLTTVVLAEAVQVANCCRDVACGVTARYGRQVLPLHLIQGDALVMYSGTASSAGGTWAARRA